MAEKIAENVKNEVGKSIIGKINVFEFSNGETFVRIRQSIRGKQVFLFQPICFSRINSHNNVNSFRTCNDNLMELLIMMDACRRSSAEKITCIIPYYGYSRSDKKDQSGAPISAKLVADMLERAGADRIVTFDFHSDQIQGFFNIPVDNLSASYLFATEFSEKYSDIQVIVSPDSGGVPRARDLSKRINWARQKLNPKKKIKKTKVAFGDKRRSSNNDKSKVTYIIGNVKDKVVLIYDDIVDTAGSLVEIANVLKKRGAKKVYAACVHGVLSGKAIKRVNESGIIKMFITDTIPFDDKRSECKKIELISIKDVLSDAIVRIYNKKSVSKLFRIDIDES